MDPHFSSARNFQLQRQTPPDLSCLIVMQKWEYRIFASHLDPAELVVIMNKSGNEGWELVTVVAVTDYHPLTLIQPEIEVPPEEAEEMVQLEAFRYIFKRPAA
jgi:hypothetical protein